MAVVIDPIGNEAAIRQHQIDHANTAQLEKIPSIITEPATIDAWRHERHYAHLLPFLKSDPDASWLTIGDSGADAFWLRKNGAKHVVASSLSETQIREIANRGYLDGVEIAAVDAQAIDYPSGSFDYVVCKEAYHHFEKPALGLYEMLRVSRKAMIFLTEPYDTGRFHPLESVRTALKVLLRSKSGGGNTKFEVAGNFIYGLSLRETQRIATALQVRPLYYSFFSDFFVPKLSARPTSDRRARLVMNLAVATQNVLARMGLTRWGKVTIALFKQPPSSQMVANLRSSGFRESDIPVNPYL